MTHPTLTRLALLLLTGAVCACSQPSRPRANAAVTAACRQEVDRVYSAQNRVDLSMRDTRDTPFAAGYLSGVPSRGLGAAFGRDNNLQSCLNRSGGAGSETATPGIGPTFTPTSTSR